MLEDECFSIPRILNAKALARELLNKAVESQNMIAVFDQFAEKIVMVIRVGSKEDKRLKLHSTKCGHLENGCPSIVVDFTNAQFWGAE